MKKQKCRNYLCSLIFQDFSMLSFLSFVHSRRTHQNYFNNALKSGFFEVYTLSKFSVVPPSSLLPTLATIAFNNFFIRIIGYYNNPNQTMRVELVGLKLWYIILQSNQTFVFKQSKIKMRIYKKKAKTQKRKLKVNANKKVKLRWNCSIILNIYLILVGLIY